MKKIIVTGNLGYIGQVLTAELKKCGYFVKGIDADFFSNGNLFDSVAEPDEQLIRDIRHIEAADLAGFDAICHLAALSNDPLGELNPQLTNEINFEATIRLAKLCRQEKVKKFLFSSTCSVYGLSGDQKLDENSVMNPLTAYAKAKIDSEVQLKKLAGDDFCPVFLRNATVYGVSPRFRIDLVLNNLTGWAISTNEIVIQSDGTPWRPLVHVEDVSLAFISLMESEDSLVSGEAFNIGIDEENFQIRALAGFIHEKHPGSAVLVKNEVIIDAKSYNVSFAKIKRSIPGFKPAWTVLKGIDELLGTLGKVHLESPDMTSERFNRIKQIQKLLANKEIDSQMFRVPANTQI